MSFNAGSAYRAGLSQLKGIRPNYLNLALMEFVPEFAEALDPIFGNLHRGMDFSSFIFGQREQIALALLRVTDSKSKEIPGSFTFTSSLEKGGIRKTARLCAG